MYNKIEYNSFPAALLYAFYRFVFTIQLFGSAKCAVDNQVCAIKVNWKRFRLCNDNDCLPPLYILEYH